MVGDMVVDAGTSLPFHFVGIAEIAGVTLLVVRPQHCHLVRDHEAVVICVKDLLIGTEHLRNLLERLVYVTTEHVALVVYRLLHEVAALGGGIGALHGVVVYAPESQRVGILVFPVGPDTLLPVVLHDLAVGDVVEVAVGADGLPFALVVAEHLLAVRRPHHDGVVVGQAGVLGIVVERCGAGVHGRPQVVAAQAEQQFEHFLIDFRPDLSGLLVEGLLDPFRPSSEALVVDEDAAVLHGRLLLQETARLDV